MFYVLAGYAALASLGGLRSFIHEARVATDIWVAASKGLKKKVMNVPLYVTWEEFESIVTRPEVWRAREEALKAQKEGLIDVCPTCDQAFQKCV